MNQIIAHYDIKELCSVYPASLIQHTLVAVCKDHPDVAVLVGCRYTEALTWGVFIKVMLPATIESSSVLPPQCEYFSYNAVL